MIKIAGEGLEGEQLEMEAACMLLTNIALNLQGLEDGDIDSEEIIEMLVQAIYDDDDETRDYGIEAFEALCKSGVILRDPTVRKFIRQFKNFNTPELLPVFFKCLRIIISSTTEGRELEDDNFEEEEFDEDPQKDSTSEEDLHEDEEGDDEADEDTSESIIPIRDFVISALKASQDMNILSGCIRILAEITNASDALLKDKKKEIRAKVFKYIDTKEYALYPAISYFIRASFESSNLQPTGKLAQRIRLILHGAKKEDSADEKSRMKCVENISAIARAVRYSLIKPVYQIGIEAVRREDEYIAAIGLKIIGNIARSLSAEQTQEAFTEMNSKIMKFKHFKNFEVLMKQLTRLITNKTIKTADVTPLLTTILESKAVVLNGIQLNQTNPVCKETFRFIGNCIKFGKAPNISKDILSLLLTSSETAVPSIVKIGINAVESGMLAESNLKTFADAVQKSLNAADLDRKDLIITASDFLRLAFVKDKTSFAPSSTFNHLGKLVKELDDEDEEYTEQIIAISLMVFTVYLTDTSQRVSISFTSNLMNHLTITLDNPHIPPLITSIILMYKSGDRFSFIKTPILSIFANIMSLIPEDLDELDLTGENEKQMTEILISECKADPKIIPKVTEDFADIEERMSQFNTILKN
jgi:hypothetical protein